MFSRAKLGSLGVRLEERGGERGVHAESGSDGLNALWTKGSFRVDKCSLF